MSATPEKFVLDANVFIQAKRRFYAFDFCPGSWDMLIWHQQHGRLCSIDKVQNEILRGGDDLAEWVKNQFGPSAFAATSTAEVTAAYSQMLNCVVAQSHFRDIAKVEFQQVADGWLAAYAKANDCVVVTMEEYDPLRTTKVPLVNVCRAFDVPTISPFDLLRCFRVQLEWGPAK